MLTTYSFSMRGRAHIKSGKPCQDYSDIVEITPAWKAVIVADGVGSCEHAEVASEMAVKAASEVLKKSFPGARGTDRDFQSLMLIAGHTAANAVEDYVRENDPENAAQYHTTLAMALCSTTAAYYLNVGDSAIVGLDENGRWHSVTKPDNDESGGVYTLAWRNHYHVGKAKFTPVCILAMTDGVYAKCFPFWQKGEEYEMDVPILNFFSTYAFGIEDEKAQDDSELQKQNIQKYFESDKCSDMTDDLSIAAVINTKTCLEEEDIPFKEPDWFSLYWKALQCSPYSDEVKKKQFMDYIKENHADFSPEQMALFAEKYISPAGSTDTLNESNESEHTEESRTEPINLNEKKPKDVLS